MAAPFQNYSGGTFLSDLVTRPAFLDYVQEEIFNRCQWIQSGALTRNAALDARAGGVRVQVPFFQPIDPTEEVIESNATWGTSGAGYLTPQKITGDEQVMPILHRGFSYAVDDLSRLGTGSDPMAAIRNQLVRAVNRLRTRTLIAQLDGLFFTALVDNNIDVSSAAASTEANYLTASTVVRAKNALGERGSDLTTIAMHSAVYAYLQQVGALTFSTSALSTGGAITWGGGGVNLNSDAVAQFMGLRVIVDDLLTPELNPSGSDQYAVYLLGEGSLAEGVQQELRVEADRNILSKQDVMSVDYHYGMHLMGSTYKGTDNPTNTVLATSSNWDLAYSTSKMVKAVRLIVNTPFSENKA